MTAHSGLNWWVPTAILSPTIKQSNIISVLSIQNHNYILLGVPKSVILLLDYRDWHIHPNPHLLLANDHNHPNNPDKIDQAVTNALPHHHTRYNHWVDVSAQSITYRSSRFIRLFFILSTTASLFKIYQIVIAHSVARAMRA